MRAGLTMLLLGAGDVRIVGEAADGEEALARAAALAPDVVLMDIRMPRMDGLVATERLRAREEAPEVVVLTTYVEEYVLPAVRAGASGFLLRHPARGDRPGDPAGRRRGGDALSHRHAAAPAALRRHGG